VILKQYYLGCLSHASYLIGDPSSGIAVVVDPQRDIDQYVADASTEGVTIQHVFLTHFHADYLAGHLELRERTGAEIHLGAKADAEFAFTPMADQQSLVFGGVRLTVLETPGHTPESICLLVYDLETEGESPVAVLTGDTLFIGDVGRPDLMASVGWTAAELGRQLYDSLHQKLLTLPDETVIYPGHGAGSMCGKQLSNDTASTIGIQRRYNYALQPMTSEQFVAMVTADQPETPAYFAHDAQLNRQERATLDQTLDETLRPLTVEAVQAYGREGAQLLDVRDGVDFAGAHLVESLNIPLSGRYATWAGSLLNREFPIVIVAEPGTEREAAVRLGRIGFDHIAGYLDGGMAALEASPTLVRRTERVTAQTLAEQLASPHPPTVVDVRTEKEWTAQHIAGSVNIPLNHLAERAAEVAGMGTIVVHCASGYRSFIAVSLLERCGVDGVADLVGGIAAWDASQLNTVAQP